MPYFRKETLTFNIHKVFLLQQQITYAIKRFTCENKENFLHYHDNNNNEDSAQIKNVKKVQNKRKNFITKVSTAASEEREFLNYSRIII